MPDFPARPLLIEGVYLIQILLPLDRNDGARQPEFLFRSVRDELVARFGGLTAYTRAPAVGLWADREGPATSDDGTGASVPRTPSAPRAEKDELVIVEVMAPELDRAWWSDFRRRLECRFEQEQIVVRALPIETL
jgi:hypothetical protein